MDFTSIKPIRKKKVYLDEAITKAKKIVAKPKTLEQKRNLMLRQITAMHDVLTHKLTAILKDFPSLDNLPLFYQELIAYTLKKDALKQTLARLHGMQKSLQSIKRDMLKQLAKSSNPYAIKNQYIARVDSLLKEEVFTFLENARRTFRTFPDIKEHLFTVCIVGFPNVGKTTLFNHLTKASAEINAYAFTTKSLNVGYVTEDYTAQIIDTPGTLNRIEKMNMIEKQAYLAMKTQADALLYVYDLTEPYPLAMQEELEQKLKELQKPLLYYCSKQDILGRKKIEQFVQMNHLAPVFFSPEEIRQWLIKEARKRRSLR